MITKTLKPKKCIICKSIYQPRNIGHKACTYQCALKLLEISNVKKARRIKKANKQSLLTKKDYLNILQSVFNKYIRLRDFGNKCISCQSQLINNYHAGHYYSVGYYPELRFNEINVNGQCPRCNTRLRGNLISYRVGIIARHGQYAMDELDRLANVPINLSISDVKNLIDLYKLKIKELNHNND